MPTYINPGIDNVWVSSLSYLIFVMQIGFAFVEAGSIRYKNIQGILLQNVSDVCVTTIMFWLIGYGFAYGADNRGIIGTTYFGASGFSNTTLYTHWVYQWAFTLTAATIVSGACAQRMQILGYMLYTMVFSGWIYPIIVHWCWEQHGWLNVLGYQDFAGSGVVHVTGGLSGLISAILIGPRIGRFSQDWRTVRSFRPGNVPFIVLGTLLLWYAWYGFNCSSTLGATTLQDNIQIGLAGMNTSISASSGGLTCVFWNYIVNKDKSSTSSTYNLMMGILGGLVGITACCSFVEPYAAFIIGIVSGLLYQVTQQLQIRFKIDDPLDVAPIHLFCGIWGVLAVGIFSKNEGAIYGFGFHSLGVQSIAIVGIVVWNILNTVPVLLMMKKLNIMRLSRHIEERGYDYDDEDFQSDQYKEQQEIDLDAIRIVSHRRLESPVNENSPSLEKRKDIDFFQMGHSQQSHRQIKKD